MARPIRALEIHPLDLMEVHHKELEIPTSIRMVLHHNRLAIRFSILMVLLSKELAIQHLVLTGLHVKKLVIQHSAIEQSNLSVKSTRLRRAAYFRSLGIRGAIPLSAASELNPCVLAAFHCRHACGLSTNLHFDKGTIG